MWIARNPLPFGSYKGNKGLLFLSLKRPIYKEVIEEYNWDKDCHYDSWYFNNDNLFIELPCGMFPELKEGEVIK